MDEWVSGRVEGRRRRRREKLLLLQRWVFLSPVPARSKVYRGFNFTFPQPIRAHLCPLERTLTHPENLTVRLPNTAPLSISALFFFTLFHLFPAPPPFPIYLPTCLFALDYRGQNSSGRGGVGRGGGGRLLFFCTFPVKKNGKKQDRNQQEFTAHDNIMWSKQDK